jgi:hypothetical protein
MERWPVRREAWAGRAVGRGPSAPRASVHGELEPVGASVNVSRRARGTMGTTVEVEVGRRRRESDALATRVSTGADRSIGAIASTCLCQVSMSSCNGSQMHAHRTKVLTKESSSCSIQATTDVLGVIIQGVQ